MNKFFLIILGGSIGSLLRYFLAGIFQELIKNDFPLGTFTVNMIAAFTIGFLWELMQNKIELFPYFKVFLFVGILGAFSTFSSYLLETLNLLKIGEWKIAIFYFISTNILGLILIFSGSSFYFLLNKTIK